MARALFDLPLCSREFENGDLSYSKARALTRVATARTEAGLLNHAISATALQVEEHCRQLRNADRHRSTLDARRAYNARSLRRSCHGNGTMSIQVELPQELGDVVMKALEQLMVESNPLDQTDSLFSQQADALVALARNYLSAETRDGGNRSDVHQVVVHVDQAALTAESGTELSVGKSDLPIESVKRISCDSEVLEITESQGQILNVGRKHRVVPPKMKQALSARDRYCRFPGCSHTRWLDAHHVKHWADGGKTSLDNLMMLCNRHHQLLHEGQYTIQKNYEGNWYFRNGTGRIIPEMLVYKPTDYDYDASRDGFVVSDTESEGNGHFPGGAVRVTQKIPVYEPADRDASRDGFVVSDTDEGVVRESPRDYCLNQL